MEVHYKFKISIHAPLRERQALSLCRLRASAHFNPRSLTGATKVAILTAAEKTFQSTLPYGSDIAFFGKCLVSKHFNPRSLTGATQRLLIVKLLLLFQSTLPYGSDDISAAPVRETCDFNPRSLTGATDIIPLFVTFNTISIHAPLRERPIRSSRFEKGRSISIHAPLRERLHINKIILHSKHFNPRSLTGATW